MRKLRLMAVATLLAALGTCSFLPRVRREDPLGCRALVARLGHDDCQERERASSTLEAIGAAALPYLREAARDSQDPEVRARARGLGSQILRQDLWSRLRIAYSVYEGVIVQGAGKATLKAAESTYALGWSRAGDRLFSAGEFRTVSEVDPDTGAVRPIGRILDFSWRIRPSPDASHLLAVTSGGTVVLDASGATKALPPPGVVLASWLDDYHLAWTSQSGDAVVVWSLETCKVERSIPALAGDHLGNQLAVDPSRGRIAVAVGTSNVGVYDLREGAWRRFGVPAGATTLFWSPEGARVAGETKGGEFVLDLVTGHTTAVGTDPSSHLMGWAGPNHLLRLRLDGLTIRA